ncbi:glutathione synthase [Brackiella oedipodis]|uniref:glutathione synthase n=1 Tax=Brackiella oedipodis TaxID=124225 RepID=UPI00048EE198|nr:glutathione synthase [Brackiella oedipodis]
MHILFIIDPLPKLSAYKDTSVAMMQALQARDCKISVCLQSDLFVQMGTVYATTQQISIVPQADLHTTQWWQYESEPQTQALKDFSAVVMRKDPPFDMEYLYATHMLERAEHQGARVFNSGRAIRNYPEKLSISEFPQYTAPTLITSRASLLKEFYKEHQDVVVKPLDGMGGQGIFRLKPDDANFNSVIEVLSRGGQQTIMIQKYLPEITAGDKRVLIINGKPIPYVLARMPSHGENRGNLAAGGKGVAQPINDNDKAIAEFIGSRLAPQGLFLIGLDIIGTHITEINVTSPTCFVEISAQTDFNVAAHFANELLQVLQQTSHS